MFSTSIYRFSTILKQKSKVRVRFAPSPTGSLHLGGLRTALYNYLFAKKNYGQFILRIEDTDQKRYVPGSVESLIKNLQYFNLQWDEGPGSKGSTDIKDYENQGSYGPYFQSMRLSIYQKYIKELLQNGDAYMCFCNADRLESLRKDQMEKKQTPKYDGHCRKLTNEQIRLKILNGEKYTIRLKVPEGETSFQDIIHGNIKISHENIDDQVLMKSDGYPTYHLANVIDDYTMKISHVIRGHEWITSTPKHLILYEALNLKPPKFAHIPLLVKKGGAKLSKRDQSTSVDYLRESEYIPEAVNNFVALLGWYPKFLEDKQALETKFSAKEEVFSVEEMATLVKLIFMLTFSQEFNLKFSLERINGSNSQVDEKKLNFLNGQHLHNKFSKLSSDENELMEFKQKISKQIPQMDDNFYKQFSKADQILLCSTIRDRIQTYQDIKHQFAFFTQQPTFTTPSELRSIEKCIKDTQKISLLITDFMNIFKQLSEQQQFIQLHLNRSFSEYLMMHNDLKNEDVYHLIRFILTGSLSGPATGTVCYLLGPKITLDRLEYFQKSVLPKINIETEIKLNAATSTIQSPSQQTKDATNKTRTVSASTIKK